MTTSRAITIAGAMIAVAILFTFRWEVSVQNAFADGPVPYHWEQIMDAPDSHKALALSESTAATTPSPRTLATVRLDRWTGAIMLCKVVPEAGSSFHLSCESR